MVSRKCIICSREFEAYEKTQANRRAFIKKYRRPKTSITCSRACSRKYRHLNNNDRAILLKFYKRGACFGV
mgnify:FL=1|jgi:hypothetical protein